MTDGEDETEIGRVIWHSTDEDSGPDVGISTGMGKGRSLWIGEITNHRWDELDDEQKAATGGTSAGWWLMIYPDCIPLARFVDAESARGFADIIVELTGRKDDQ